MEKTLTDRLRATRRAAVPLVAVATPDPVETVRAVRTAFENGAKTPIAVVQWDALNGLVGLNQLGQAALAAILKSSDVAEWPAFTANPGAALAFLAEMPGETRDASGITQRGSIAFMLMANRFFEDEPGVQKGQVIQGIANLREAYKANRRTLVMLGAGFRLPPELAQDVVLFDEPYPDDAQLREIIDAQAKRTPGLEPLDAATVESSVDALRGLAAFPAEQIVAMSLTKDGMDVAELWQRKLAVVEQTPGFTVDRGDESFDDVRGLENFTDFGMRLIRSKRSPTLYVRVDEIEKSFGGLGSAGGPGDNTGVTQDRLGVLLKEMEDNGWTGFLAVGHAGTGKSLVTKSLANTATKTTGRRVLSLALDLGATSGGIVGASEAKIRAVMKVIKSLAAGGRVCFVGTCNELRVLPPALKRRFKLGTWMFDLPEREEKDAMWALNLKKFGVKKQPLPDDTDWTGADIRNVCDAADNLECSLAQACQYLTFVAKSDPDAVAQLRLAADGKYISASKPGTYKAPFTTKPFGAGTRAVGKEA
jgi:hypothetical protein